MDEMERMRSDITQLTRRVDDFTLRLAVIEAATKSFDDKLDGLRELIELKLTNMNSSIEGWNRLGFWLLTAIGGSVVAAVIAWVVSGGLRLHP
jgi:hypothetical protein